MRHVSARTPTGEAPFEAIVEAMPVPVFVKGADGRYLAVNAAFEEFTGLSREQLIGTALDSIYPPEQAARFRKADDELLAGGGQQVYETVIASATEHRNIMVHKSTCDFGTGPHIVGQFVDVTARKSAEAELRRERRLLYQVIETIPAYVFWVDRSMVVRGCNSAFEIATSFGTSDVIGRPLAEIGQWEPDQGALDALGDIIESGVAQRHHEVTLDGPAGSQITVQAHGVPLRGDGGSIIGMLGMGIDITEQRSLQAQVATASRLESIGQLAAGVAHEINTPAQFVGDNLTFALSGIEGLVRSAQAGIALAEAVRAGSDLAGPLATLDAAVDESDVAFVAAELPDAINQSLEGIHHISRIVRAMKDLAHPSSDTPEPVDVNRLIDATATVATNEWKYAANLELDLDPGLPLVVCRAAELNQVLLNLLVNAAHAISDGRDDTDEKGRITVTSRLDGEHVELRVGDTGCGIPPEHRNRVFNPFFTTKEIGRGTGQGLALAHSIIVAGHGGQLTFETEVDVGTTFVVRLRIDGATITGPNEERRRAPA